MKRTHWLTPLALGALICLDPVLGTETPPAERESPMLTNRVADGSLPALAQRLPTEPALVDGGGRIGHYGGQLRVISSSVHDLSEVRWLCMEPMLRFAADGRTVVPNVARRWEVSDGGRTITIYLRAGMHWSDGQPITVEDVLFAYEEVISNEELRPVMPRRFMAGGAPMKIEPVDEFTFRAVFKEPYGAFPIFLTHMVGSNALLAPKHYLKQFHVKYARPDELDKLVKAHNFDFWHELFNDQNFTARLQMAQTPPNYPTIVPWRVVSVPAEGQVILERNPYYWKVDRAGRQLPYIDKIHSSFVGNPEARDLKLISGMIDLGALEGGFDKSSLYLANTKFGGYQVHFWEGNWGSRVGYYLNQTHRDPVLRKIFQTREFRIALSLGIDRQEMNEVLYYGKCQPRQVTVNRACSFFVPEYENAYVEYDPKRANEMLDELGLQHGPGGRWRRRPDGKMLTISVDVLQGGFQPQTAEMIREYWGDLGIHMVFRVAGGNLYWTRFSANAMDLLCTPDDVASDVMVLNEVAYGVHYWAPLWYQYLVTDGRNGTQPPPSVMKLYDLWQDMRRTADDQHRIELGRRMMRSQAENLWGIGTVGRQLWPIIVSGRLHNVPPEGLWGYPWLATFLHHPEQFYLSDTE